MSKDINDMMNKMLNKVSELGKQASDMVQKGANKVQEASDKAKKTSQARSTFMNEIVPGLRDMMGSMGNYDDAALLDAVCDVDNNQVKLVDDVLVKLFGDMNDKCAVKHGLDALLKSILVVKREASLSNFAPNGIDVLATFDIIADGDMVEIADKKDLIEDQSSANDESTNDEKDDAKSNDDEAESIDDPDFESLAASLQGDLKDALKEAMQDPTFKKMVSMFKDEAEKDDKKED